MIDSEISLSPEKDPPAKTPSLVGHAGREASVRQNPSGLRSIPANCARALGTFRRPLPGSQDHHVKYFIMFMAVGVHIMEPERPVFCRFDRMDPASYETHPGFLFRRIAVALEIFSESPHVHVEDGGIDRAHGPRFGEQGFLYGKHAADRRAVICFLLKVP